MNVNTHRTKEIPAYNSHSFQNMPTLIDKTAKNKYGNVRFPRAYYKVCPSETKLLPSSHMKEVPK